MKTKTTTKKSHSETDCNLINAGIDIIVNDESKLGVRSREIDVLADNVRLRNTVAKLKQTIKHRNLSAISAVQIGDEWEFEDNIRGEIVKETCPPRVFCIKFGDTIRTFIDPIITSASGLSLSREKCSCYPDREFLRVRNNDITLTFMSPTNKVESTHLVGKAAFVAQHQIDHLDGITLPLVGLEIFEDFDQATEEERQSIIDMYLESLDLRLKNLNKEIEEDEILSKTANAIKFMEKVQKGEIELDINK